MEDQKVAAMPPHIEKATFFINDLANMNHKEQVEAFNHVRKNLIDLRRSQYEGMLKEIESFNIDSNIQNDGTKIIMSEL